LQDLIVKIQEEFKILPHIGNEKMPNTWITIRNLLESKKEDYMSFDEYLTLAREVGIADGVQATRIATIMHELGIILYFAIDSILRNIVILNKQWATEAVYLVLLDRGIAEKYGRYSFKDLDRIWEKYPASKRNDLLQLMIKFLLCYEVTEENQMIDFLLHLSYCLKIPKIMIGKNFFVAVSCILNIHIRILCQKESFLR
jgi:internalin A